MSSQNYVNGVTLSDATEFNRFDTAAYPVLTSVAGTNTVTATGPANYSLAASMPPVVIVPAVTNTGAVTLNITPSGGAALGAKNVFFNGAAMVGGEWTAGDVYLVTYDGTQFNSSNVRFPRGTTSTTFTFNGSGSESSAVTLTYQKIGQFVMINIPAVSATTGTNSNALVSNTAIPAAFRPSAAQYGAAPEITNNGATVTGLGEIIASTNGTFSIRRDGVPTNFTNSATGGLTVATTIIYFTG